MRPLRPFELPPGLSGRQIRRALDWRDARLKGLLPRDWITVDHSSPRSPAEILDHLDARCVELEQRIFGVRKLVRR